MDIRAEVREFLVSRRANLTPDQAGLQSHGRRRVPGLRRSEVAALAGSSSALIRPKGRAARPWSARPGLQWTLDAITDAPAIVGNDRLDLLAANHLGRALYSDHYSDPRTPPNFARFTFLDSAARRFYPDWESLDLRAEPGLTMTIYAAEPASPTEQALALLASWAATHHPQPTGSPT